MSNIEKRHLNCDMFVCLKCKVLYHPKIHQECGNEGNALFRAPYIIKMCCMENLTKYAVYAGSSAGDGEGEWIMVEEYYQCSVCGRRIE